MTNLQRFKPVYFSDHSQSRGLTLAFGERHEKLYESVNNLESSEIRELLGTNSYRTLERRAEKEGLLVNTYCLWYLNKKLSKRVGSKHGGSPAGRERIPHQPLNRIIEGDCLDVMPAQIGDESVDMILCDLPYGTTQNKWDSEIPLDRLWREYERVIKPRGAIVLTAHGRFTAQLILSNSELFKYKITWIKSKPTNFLNAKKQPLRKHEDILVFYKNQPHYDPQFSYGEPYSKGFRKDQLTGSYGDFKTVEVKSDGRRYPTDVVYFKTAESEGQVWHPTQKPVELARYLIRTFTNPGDVVLDNACGSGSFPVAAILENRKFIGIEKNQEVYLFKNKRIDYVEVCRNRVKEAEDKLTVSNRLF